MYTHTYVYNHRFGMIHGCHEHEFMEVKNATSHVLLIIALRPGIVQVIQVGVPMFFCHTHVVEGNTTTPDVAGHSSREPRHRDF